MKNYNEQLNQKGDCNFIMKKTITKDNKVKKAFVYIPDEKEKASRFASRFCKRAGDGDIAISIQNSYCVIADDKVMLCIKPDDKVIYKGFFNNLTGRGLRLNEKYIEGAIDYLKTYHNIPEADITISEKDWLDCKADCFKTKASELTIDDLLDL